MAPPPFVLLLLGLLPGQLARVLMGEYHPLGQLGQKRRHGLSSPTGFGLPDKVEGIVALEFPAEVVDLLEVHSTDNVHTHGGQDNAAWRRVDSGEANTYLVRRRELSRCCCGMAGSLQILNICHFRGKKQIIPTVRMLMKVK